MCEGFNIYIALKFNGSEVILIPNYITENLKIEKDPINRSEVILIPNYVTEISKNRKVS